MITQRAVRNRIESVGKIKKIADALEIVALTRLRRMEQETLTARAYFEKIRQMLFDMSAHINFKSHPLLMGRREIKTIAAVCIFSDKGLCGDFNANLVRRFSEFTLKHKDKKIKAAVIGKKGIRYFRRRRNLVLLHANNAADPGIAEITRSLIDGFLKEDIDEIYLLYSRFRLHLLGEANIIKLIPFTPEQTAEEDKGGPYERDYIYEPDAYSVFDSLVREYAANQIDHGLLESRCAEEMSRMLAMKAATDNADEMITRLRLAYNKTRQAQITKELTEVIAAAEGRS